MAARSLLISTDRPCRPILDDESRAATPVPERPQVALSLLRALGDLRALRAKSGAAAQNVADAEAPSRQAPVPPETPNETRRTPRSPRARRRLCGLRPGTDQVTSS